MDKTVAGLLGVMGALVVATPSQATPVSASAASVLHAQNYSELLRPVPNAVEALRALDAAAVDRPAVVEDVQYRDHHHHHHHRYYRRRVSHHHHHHRHHHHGGILGAIIR